MITKINTLVSVGLVFDHKTMKVYPKWISWNNRTCMVEKVGLHHTYREGRTLFHVFSVCTKELFFRLVLNSETLHWRLEELTDGFTN